MSSVLLDKNTMGKLMGQTQRVTDRKWGSIRVPSPSMAALHLPHKGAAFCKVFPFPISSNAPGCSS